MSRNPVMVWMTLAAALIVGAAGADGDEPGAMMAQPGRSPGVERVLIQSLFDVRDGHLDEALGKISTLTEDQPDFELAHLVQGDVLMALSSPLKTFGEAGSRDAVSGLQAEARARLERYVEAPREDLVPASLLQVPTDAESILLIDLEMYRLYLFSNKDGRPQLEDDYYVSIGKGGSYKQFEGDEKTPVGVYLVSSFLPGSQLPDMYGPGAFPITYPNRWDRLRGRTGSGIWIHGTESERFSRPPLSSLGCVTLSNSDFRSLSDRVQVTRTPVIVSDRVDWVTRDQLDDRLDAVQFAVESWRAAWESRDTAQYLEYYAEDFQAEKMDRNRFAAHKRRVNASKKFIEVELSDVAVYGYPGETDLVLLEFEQEYRSNNFSSVRQKQQYWQNRDGEWKIVYEGDA